MNTRSFIENPVLELDPVLNKLYGWFGLSTAFMPLPLGQQAPANDQWRGITLERSRSSAHLNLLWNSDIAVMCGPASISLCGVRFNDGASLARFKELNLGMKTLTTKHPDGVWLWLRITGFVPKTQDLPDCFWQANGFVKIYERSPYGDRFFVLEPVQPAVVKFDSICWSPDTTLLVLPQIIEDEYGHSFEPAVNGVLRPNYPFWSKYFALANGICYVPTQRSFYVREPGENEWSYLSEERVQDLFVRWIMQLKKSKGHERITGLAQPEGLKRILEALRVVAVGELPPERDIMVEFLDTCIDSDENSSATTQELYAAFKNLCASKSLAPMPLGIFRCVIAPLLKQRFGVCNSHSLVRNGVCRRGFNYIRLANVPSGTHGTRGTREGEEERQFSCA